MNLTIKIYEKEIIQETSSSIKKKKSCYFAKFHCDLLKKLIFYSNVLFKGSYYRKNYIYKMLEGLNKKHKC